MKELMIAAVIDNIEVVAGFINEQLENMDCPMKAQMQISVAVEEVFVNIANYAYTDASGEVVIHIERKEDPMSIEITFADRGVPYDPLKKENPDVTLSAEERQIGGLGIFMVKKLMDDIRYEYRDRQNILVLRKYI